MERVTRRKFLIKTGLTALGGTTAYIGFAGSYARSNKYREQIRSEDSGVKPFQELELVNQRIKESGEEGLQILEGILCLGGITLVMIVLDLIPQDPYSSH